MNILSILFNRHIREKRKEKTKAILNAKKKRKEAEKRIDSMIAQINGCGDRWFLQPIKAIDECEDENTHQNGS